MRMTSTPPFETAKGGQTPHSSRNLQSCEGSLWGVITRSPAPKPGLCGRLSNHSEGEQRAVKLTEGALYVDVASGSCPEVLGLYLERPLHCGTRLRDLGRALQIQRLEGSPR